MRKTLNVTIEADGGRDAGKVFVLTEMPAIQAEKWALKIFLALGHAGVSIPDNITEMGVGGLVYIGAQALRGLYWQDAEPILDEMMQYFQIMPDPKKPTVVRSLVDDDIEEISTFLYLRKKYLFLNIGFLEPAAA